MEDFDFWTPEDALEECLSSKKHMEEKDEDGFCSRCGFLEVDKENPIVRSTEEKEEKQ